MKSQRFISSFLACTSLLSMSFVLPSVAEVPVSPTLKIAGITASPKCDPHVGTWYYQDKSVTLTRDSDRTNTFKVRMNSFGRSIPFARGRILSPTQIEVDFPAAGTFIETPGTYIGTLNGQGKISWSNGKEWEAITFYGSWIYEGKRGPSIMKARANSDDLKISMSAYSRPPATGYKTSVSQAVFQFPDDATYTAILVSPTCIKWSNGTIWEK
jgi:hypothetical protein